MEEEERGGRRRQGEAEKNREARLALRLGRRARGDDDGAEESAGRGRGWRRKRAAGDDGGGGLVLRGPFAVWMEAERGVVVAAVACYFLGQEGWFVEGLIGRRQFYFG